MQIVFPCIPENLPVFNHLEKELKITSFAVQKDVSGTYSFKLFPASTEQFSRNLL